MPKNSGKQPKIDARGDVRVTFPPAVMQKLRQIAKRENREIYQQVQLYVARAVDAEAA